MAAPTWVAAGTKTEKPSDVGTTSTVAPPAGHAAGDLLVIAAQVYQSKTLATPAGWTLLYDSGGWGTSSFYRSYLFWKLAASGSEPSVTLTTSGGAYNDSQMYAFRGVHATTPVDIAAVSGSVVTVASVPTPALTTVTNDALMVYVGFDIGGQAWNTPPAGSTERVESTAYIGKFVVATETKTTAGTEAADSYVRQSGTTDFARVVGFAVRPAAAATTTARFKRLKLGTGISGTDLGGGVLQLDIGYLDYAALKAGVATYGDLLA